MRATTRVLMGSFAAARRSDSRATASLTPSISNMMRPGFTRATQNSGVPLPLPIRTSVGFFDTGTSGNSLIHTLPERFICRVMARRAASICRAVMRAGLKLYLMEFRNEGVFCEALAVRIRDDVAEALDLPVDRVLVTLVQKARGGITITATS